MNPAQKVCPFCVMAQLVVLHVEPVTILPHAPAKLYRLVHYRSHMFFRFDHELPKSTARIGKHCCCLVTCCWVYVTILKLCASVENMSTSREQSQKARCIDNKWIALKHYGRAQSWQAFRSLALCDWSSF